MAAHLAPVVTAAANAPGAPATPGGGTSAFGQVQLPSRYALVHGRLKVRIPQVGGAQLLLVCRLVSSHRVDVCGLHVSEFGTHAKGLNREGAWGQGCCGDIMLTCGLPSVMPTAAGHLGSRGCAAG